MKTIEILVSIFKYGGFKELEVNTFESHESVMMWINNILRHTERTKIEEAECGESLNKYTGTFNYSGIDYIVYLDI